VGVLFAIIAVVCLVAGVVNYFQEEAWFARAEQAQATVTAYDLHVRDDGKSEFCQRIEFITRGGQPATSYTEDCPSHPDKTQIGRRLTVYYDPSDPSDTRSKGWAGNEGSGLIFGVVGFVFFLGIGAFSVWFDMRQAARVRGRSGAGGLNNIMRQDAERYRANQKAADRARNKPDNK
jgi:hypothetical protein